MKFNFPAFGASLVLVLLSGVASVAEGTFTSKRVTIGFLNHGGMWGDLIILSVVTGALWPYLSKSMPTVLPVLSFALAIAIGAHAQWANWMQSEGITGHIFPAHRTGR